MVVSSVAKSLSLHEHFRAGQLAQERGLAGVGVAHDGGVGHGARLRSLRWVARCAARRPRVRFVRRSIWPRILRLSCSSWLSPSPLAPMPPPCWPKWLQARVRREREVGHAGEIDLQGELRLGAGAGAEDIEDDLLAVDATVTLESLLPVRAVGRG